ncbi:MULTISPECIES: hypothetical protein [unclassified Saccharibacter]|uniref:hypothetical protein n=1 Tax=unclassified Saccharibacter TaxID=2648722 RepID=UPI001323A36B|nr:MULTISPECIES: hypothetical protein [unclassified Saccharibacter]MXV35806.1 hypothetical protein [Saccharibacter sp. EH611]MXV57927.1 hypothetical protein [Saccharibacter sp. EH70]MXV66322.1 hypothetical protein [Saccharibacter sp. EH60]
MDQTVMECLSNALGPYGDMDITRNAVVAFLEKQRSPYQYAGTLLYRLEGVTPAGQQDAWFHVLMLHFLDQLPSTQSLGSIIKALKEAAPTPTYADRLEQQARRCWVPGRRRRLKEQARKARLHERVRGSRLSPAQ